MTTSTLTPHDLSILSKIKDPESSLASAPIIDPSLPKDPHVSVTEYKTITRLESSIISSLQVAEMKQVTLPSNLKLKEAYLKALQELGDAIEKTPRYASLRNNRAQVLRRIYGDCLLVKEKGGGVVEEGIDALDGGARDEDLIKASNMILDDLQTTITLLTPNSPNSPISPQAAKTLSQAFTQRGALYHLTAKYLSIEGRVLRIDGRRREVMWEKVEFEEAASRDFMMGGRFGNEIAKGLAVSVNPTAKLCGEIVSEAMKREYAGGV